ncbi:hypothetical protein [Halonotius pteroides]|nr:hypothetical protein [Halonotius pteroides]
MEMLWWGIWFGMPIESKLHPSISAVMEIVTLVFCPDDIKTPTRTRTESSIDCNGQLRLWIKPTVETVMTDEWFSVKEDVSNVYERVVVDWAGITSQISHRQARTLLAS